MVHQDRAARVFSEWKDRIRNRSAWQTPLGICLTLSVTLATTSFTDFSLIRGGTIKGIFIACFLVAIAWLIYEFVQLCRTRGTSAEKFIEDLAAGTEKKSYAVEGSANHYSSIVT